MQLTAQFVEYLVVGALMLLWVAPFMYRLNVPLPFGKDDWVILLPAIYCAGMMIDALGHQLTAWHRDSIRAKADKKYLPRYGLSAIEHATADVDLLAVSPELAQAAEARTTRMRIARGAATNAILGALLWLGTIAITGDPAPPWLLVLVPLSAGVIWGLWGMWARWQRISFRFETKAIALTRKSHSSQRLA